MALWKLSWDCGEDHYLELQDEKESAEIAGLQLINEIRDAVSRRISLAFDNSIILDIAQKTIEEIYDTLKEEQKQLINIWLTLSNFEILDIAQKTIEEIDDKLKEEQPIYEKVERMYKDFIMWKWQPIIISTKGLMKVREKIRGMINIDKFKEECMQDPVLECYDWKELSIKIFDIFKELKDSWLIYDARLLDDEYYDLIWKKEKEIIKNHKDLYKHRGVLIDQYVKWRKEFKDWADKVF